LDFHDWPDEESVAVLTNVKKVTRPASSCLREPSPVDRIGAFAPIRQARVSAAPIVNAFQLAG
jgi:hypothetical protein